MDKSFSMDECADHVNSLKKMNLTIISKTKTAHTVWCKSIRDNNKSMILIDSGWKYMFKRCSFCQSMKSDQWNDNFKYIKTLEKVSEHGNIENFISYIEKSSASLAENSLGWIRKKIQDSERGAPKFKIIPLSDTKDKENLYKAVKECQEEIRKIISSLEGLEKKTEFLVAQIDRLNISTNPNKN